MTPFQKAGSDRQQEGLLKMLARTWSLAQDALLSSNFKQIVVRSPRSSVIFFVEGNVSQLNWWSLVHCSSCRIAGIQLLPSNKPVHTGCRQLWDFNDGRFGYFHPGTTMQELKKGASCLLSIHRCYVSTRNCRCAWTDSEKKHECLGLFILRKDEAALGEKGKNRYILFLFKN